MTKGVVAEQIPEQAPVHTRRPRAKRRMRMLLLGIPLVGFLELCAHLFFALRPPPIASARASASRDQTWQEAAAAVQAEKRPGDLIVIAPSWADPLARQALGDARMPLRDVARPDITRYESALELSILGQRAPELSDWHEQSRTEHGKFLIRRLVNPHPARVIFDFTDHVRPPFADVRGTEPAVSCAWNARARIIAGGLGGHPTFSAQRFECPGGEFFNVGVTVIADQAFRPRRCIWSHPFARGELVIRFRNVPLGQVIRGHAGMYWIIERERKGAPVTLSVRVDGEQVGSATHKDGEGWAGFEFPLGAHAGKAAAEVEFGVRAVNYVHRHYCFEADTR